MSARREFARPLDLRHGCIDLSHGAGGRAAAQLVAEIFAPALGDPSVEPGDDAALLPAPAPGERLAMSCDAHVVSPRFFPGGDIGALAVHGTVNDVAMLGARPRWLSAGFVLEEGLALAELARIAQSMGRAAREAGVAVVTGDTKVVERGKGDGCFIATTGVGFVPAGRTPPSGRRARPGDAVLVSGSIGDHGVAVMSQRESLGFGSAVVSDSAPLNGLVEALFDALPDDSVRTLRDPTRGGVATALNEIARQSGVGMLLREAALPVRADVAAACELLGLDPLYVANEGKLLAVVAPEAAAAALDALRAHPLGRDAAIVGEVRADAHRFVQMHTAFGGQRIVDWLAGEQLPRIC